MSNSRAKFTPGSRPSHPHFKDLSGQSFGMLRVEAYAGRIGTSHAFSCQCECGGSVITRGYCLTSGMTKSCGCLKAGWAAKNKVTHGLSRSNEYAIWAGMKNRCLNKNVKAYPRYGGVGIKICDRWLHGENGKSGVECFFEDMGPRPSRSHSLDRYPDWDGNYEPGNVRWATASEQQHNKKGNPRIAYQGRELQPCEWAAETGIPASEIAKRIRRGWTAERALTQPLRRSSQ